jgi:hypothetical protein
VPTAVGIPKEIKDQEDQVLMQPDAVVELVHHGHEVIIQSGTSKDSGFSDEEYESAGGRVVESADEVFEAEVKELIAEENDRFREGKELFHLSPSSGGQVAHRVLDGPQSKFHRLRDGRAPRREPAAPGPDEWGGREDFRAGGAAPGEHAGWGRAP